MLTVKEVRTEDGFLSLKSDWERLLNSSPDPCPFLTHEWVSLWWKHFGRGRELYVLTVYENGQIVAILPLMTFKARVFRRIPWLPGNTVQTIGNYHSNRVDLICPQPKPVYLESIWDTLLKHRGWHFLRLYPVLESSEVCSTLRNMVSERGLKATFTDNQASPYIKTSGDWQQYLAGIAREYRRKGNRAEQAIANGNCTHRVVEGGPTLDMELDRVFEVDSKGWAGQQGTGISSTPELKAFYRELAHLADRMGWLRLALVEFAGQLGAFQINLHFNATLYNLKVAFDPRFKRQNPGHTANWVGISRAFRADSGISEWNFLGDEDAYKLRWTETVRNHLKVCVYRPGNLYANILFWVDTGPARWIRNRFRHHHRQQY